MRAQQNILLATMVAAGLGLSSAHADDGRGTMDQQAACTPDVWRLCGAYIPDRDSIVACLRQNTPQLSGACRAVFETTSSVQQRPGARRAAQPRSAQQRPRMAQPRAYEVDEEE